MNYFSTVKQEHIHLPFCGLVQFPVQVQALVHFLWRVAHPQRFGLHFPFKQAHLPIF
jgi:hypothetical protein